MPLATDRGFRSVRRLVIHKKKGRNKDMSLVTTTEMFKKAYDGGYAIGAFNINNMEIVQGITEAAHELNSPIVLQASQGARKYANSIYLVKQKPRFKGWFS
jgi:hypothetical protein